MNNRCPWRPVPLCLPLLLREFLIISSQQASFGVLLESLFQKRLVMGLVALVLLISYIIICEILQFLLLSFDVLFFSTSLWSLPEHCHSRHAPTFVLSYVNRDS